MIHIQSNNRGLACQKGFLLIEALIALSILTILMATIASWYCQNLRVHQQLCEKLKAVTLAASYLGELQAARRVPQAGNYEIQGYRLTTQVQKDAVLAKFFWIEIQVRKKGAETGTEKIAVISSGVAI